MIGLVYRIEHDPDAPDPRKEFDHYSPDEVEAWQAGEVYGWIVERVWVNDDHELESEFVDSCWGYYGESGRLYAIECAREAIEWLERKAA